MVDAIVHYRWGEKLPAYVTETATMGTLHLTAQPTVLATARDGTVLLNGVNATGYDSSTGLTSASAWYNLDTLPYTATDRVVMVFTLQVTGSDGIVRTSKPSVAVYLLN